jgi:ligand-binding SRPBCC domain-containing protein
MGYLYQTEQWLPYPVHVLFEFFVDPDNLPLLMPGWQKARIEKVSIVAPPRPPGSGQAAPAAGVGSRITLSFRPFPFSPVRVRWEAEIAEFVWNSYFCDRQLRGPFAHWHHCHRVRSVDQEGIDVSVIVDQVEYDLPFGTMGKLAHRLFIRRQIERTFAYRQREIARLFRHVAPQSAPSQRKSA